MGTIFHNFSFSILLLFSNSFYVIDGDTVKENTGEKKTLRLIAIDAPEKSQFFGDSCEAKKKKLGLWKYENPIDPYYYRKSQKN